jgi:2'-5' RNA ligase
MQQHGADGEEATFGAAVERLRDQGARDLDRFGASVDRVLAGEITCPGSDQRCGVNLVCRPPVPVLDLIARLQDHLAPHEPEQYYYPPADLHLTLVEICHSRPAAEILPIAQAAADRLPSVLSGVRAPAVRMPRFIFDARGCVLSLLPVDGGIQDARRAIRERLEAAGVPVVPRYSPSSAHVTFMRYRAPLRRPADWMAALRAIQVDVEVTWAMARVWLTHGANWYGMASRITVIGPFALEEARPRSGDRAGQVDA